MQNNRKWIIGIVAALLLVCLCVCAVVAALGGLALFSYKRVGSGMTPGFEVTLTAPLTLEADLPTFAPLAEDTPMPEPTADLASPTQASGADSVVSASTDGAGAEETLHTLEKSVVPINDPRDLVGRLEGS